MRKITEPKLVFSTDRLPGYRRVRSGRGFRYFSPDGQQLSKLSELQRIRSLAVPPAYEGVWICQDPFGHLQATGMDARGRKQYRYHPLWHQHAGIRKFSQLPEFVRALPRIRHRARAALRMDILSRDRVIAGIVALLDTTGFRIGNRRYAVTNRTYGLSSLLAKHLRETNNEVTFRFIGKSGQPHEASVASPALVRLIHELQELPGQHLFRFEGADQTWHDVESADINSWLKETGGGDFSAKQFRTWRATMLCAKFLALNPPPESSRACDKEIRKAIKQTAALLLHTVATCRKFYIHPAVLTAYRKGDLYRMMGSSPPQSLAIRGLKADERKILWLLSRYRKISLDPETRSP